MGALWMAGNLTNRYLQHVSTDFRRSMVAAAVALSVSVGMVIVDLSGGFSLLWLAIPSGLVYFSAATIWPNLYAICLGRFPHAGGAANGLVSGMFCLISFVFTLAGTMLQSTTAWPLWSIFSVAIMLALLILAVFLRRTLIRGVGRLEPLIEV